MKRVDRVLMGMELKVIAPSLMWKEAVLVVQYNIYMRLRRCGLNSPGMYAHFISRVAGSTYCKLLDLSVHDKLQPEFVLSMFVMTFLNILIDIP